jgi:GSH-dependent disulfide-bond oxidoreductase
VMNRRLADREFLAGDYSIADMASVSWAKGWERMGQDIEEFPHVKRWLETMLARPAVQRGLAVKPDGDASLDLSTDKDAQAILFNQRAR